MRETSEIVAGGTPNTKGSKASDAAASRMMASWSVLMPGVCRVLQDAMPIAGAPWSVPVNAGHSSHPPSSVRKESF